MSRPLQQADSEHRHKSVESRSSCGPFSAPAFRSTFPRIGSSTSSRSHADQRGRSGPAIAWALRLSASARPGTSVVTTLVPLLLIFLLTRGREVYAGNEQIGSTPSACPSSTRSQVQPLVFPVAQASSSRPGDPTSSTCGELRSRVACLAEGHVDAEAQDVEVTAIPTEQPVVGAHLRQPAALVTRPSQRTRPSSGCGGLSSPPIPSRAQRQPGCPRPGAGLTAQTWAQAEHDAGGETHRWPAPQKADPTSTSFSHGLPRSSPWTCTYGSGHGISPAIAAPAVARRHRPPPAGCGTVCRIAPS